MPIVSIRNGDGPVVLLLGGIHGDEYEGQVALSRLAQTLNTDQITGQVIILPMANYPAARAGLRTSPLDDGNLNRMFSGTNLLVGPTGMIAHFIEHEIMPQADYMLDIHSGGSSMRYRKPTLLLTNFDEPEKREAQKILVHELGFPRAVLHPESRGSGYSTSAAMRQSVLGMTAEMAGGGNVDTAAMKLLHHALPRYLATCGVYHGDTQTVCSSTEFFCLHSGNSYLYAQNEGVFEPAPLLKDQVQVDDVAGWIHCPDIPMTDPVTLRFKAAGTVLSSRVPARVERGDCLYEIGISTAPNAV